MKQQWSKMSSQDLKIRFEVELSCVNCQMFSNGFGSKDFGDEIEEVAAHGNVGDVRHPHMARRSIFRSRTRWG